MSPGANSSPPEDEVYFALLVRSAKAQLLKRLADMKALGAAARVAGEEPPASESEDESEESSTVVAASPIRYSHRNNLVAVYVASDGRIYLRNARFWDSLSIDLTPFGPVVEADGIVVALYPPAVSARRSLLAREFVGYLGHLIGREKVHELRVWPDEDTLGPAMRRMRLASSEAGTPAGRCSAIMAR